MKKILIFYASYGGGHLSAAKSIKQYLDSNYQSLEVKMVDCIKYINKPLEKITTQAYKEMAKKAPWAWGHVYYHSQTGVLSKISSSSNKLMALKLFKLFDEFKPDLVITTHPFGSQMTSYLKKKEKTSCKLATVMTDFAPHDQWLVGRDFIDYFFVSHIGMKQALVSSGISSDKIHATGIPLSNRFLMNYDKNQIKEEFSLDPNKKLVLFFGGGEFGLGKSQTLEIFKTLIEEVEEVQIVAISGKNEKMKKHFEEIVQYEHKDQDVKILSYTNQVPELMSVSDLVITKPGGLTTTESLASGLPMVIINPIPGQEEENAEFLEKSGVAIWIKKGDNCKEIFSSLFSSPEKMKKMKINAKLLAKRHSTKDICEILLQNEGRRDL